MSGSVSPGDTLPEESPVVLPSFRMRRVQIGGMPRAHTVTMVPVALLGGAFHLVQEKSQLHVGIGFSSEGAIALLWEPVPDMVLGRAKVVVEFTSLEDETTKCVLGLTYMDREYKTKKLFSADSQGNRDELIADGSKYEFNLSRSAFREGHVFSMTLHVNPTTKGPDGQPLKVLVRGVWVEFHS